MTPDLSRALGALLSSPDLDTDEYVKLVKLFRSISSLDDLSATMQERVSELAAEAVDNGADAERLRVLVQL